MSRFRRLVLAGGLVGTTLGLGAPAVAGPTAAAIVPGSTTQHALAVRVQGGSVLARACRAGSACDATGGVTFALPENAIASKAGVEGVSLEGDVGIAIVRVPLKDGGAWALLLAASEAGQPPAVKKKLSGTIDAPRGKVAGERFWRVLLREKTPLGARIVIGKRYENASVCGHQAVIAARQLDPTDMSWKRTHARSLSTETMKNATAVNATRSATPFDVTGPRLLTATVASSAVGKTRSGMTDEDLTTRWAENRPGMGKGELISMNGSEDIAITGFDLVIRPTEVAAPKGAAPKSFFIVTTDDVFRVTMPEDAWTVEPGQTYRVDLPQPVKSDCVSIVLDEGFVDGERDRVGFAELRARTELDGKSHAELAQLLNGDDPSADAARALLARSGKPAVKAVMDAYAGLDRRGKGRALEVVEAGSCVDTAAFQVDRLLGRGVDLKAFEPDLDPLAQRARANLRGCRGAASDALRTALQKEAPGKRRVIAARELADIAPAVAVGAILDVLEDGSTAPNKSGADDVVRRGLRRALGTAVKHRRGKRAAGDALTSFGELSLVKQIDLLRALGPTIAEHPAAATALQKLFTPKASFRTRYLLLPPAAHLARAGNAPAQKLVRDSLVAAKSPHLRARAAAVAGGIDALAAPMVKALSDASPRVREAALAGMAAAGTIPKPAMSRVAALLTKDKWTFVRMGAARALAKEPAGASADTALLTALDDESNVVRRAVIRALGERKSVAAGEQIQDVADDATEPVSVRTAAIATLGELCRTDSVDLLYKLALRAGYQQLPYDQPLGLAALAALGEIHPPDLAERLAPLLKRDERVPRAIRSIARDVIGGAGSCK